MHFIEEYEDPVDAYFKILLLDFRFSAFYASRKEMATAGATTPILKRQSPPAAGWSSRQRSRHDRRQTGFQIDGATIDVFARALRHGGSRAGDIENQVTSAANELQAV